VSCKEESMSSPQLMYREGGRSVGLDWFSSKLKDSLASPRSKPDSDKRAAVQLDYSFANTFSMYLCIMAGGVLNWRGTTSLVS
jgi:hypothetical protein